MKLNKNDKEILKKWGNLDKDMRQLQEAANKTKYELHYTENGKYASKRIGVKEVIAVLGREEWLSGISRSAFHWTCAKPVYGGGMVYFDSGAIFEG